ncbi:hypothetical protein GGQ68_004863 [Sagittula marina]|uniref:Uncharacterized protein n=1 Tax=Sagittula marina TaxID=943940 RepID=A0A7W6DSS0_9RHOB|nr:hypothetical protein [Sagittula marina]MBB3988506.1 hypothetical protein [Sagittula marina]PHR63259.1 MAG: hypothetical protein COA51_11275 [Idiomarina sp.]
MEEKAPAAVGSNILELIVSNDWALSFTIKPIPFVVLAFIIALAFIAVRILLWKRLSRFEIDSAEFGIGDQKISFRPNTTDRQIAYSIWVELSTRKVGLPIDPEHDVIEEIYNSWYTFFGVTREMIKDIPISKVRGDSTSQIISLSVEVLNEGLRPHLTKWQARFRHWYEKQMETKSDADPQSVQKNFPAYDELVADLLTVNQRLIKYREKMNELARS